MRTKTAILAVFLLWPVPSFATKPYVGDFKLDVHIRESRLEYGCNSSFLGNPGNCGMRLVIMAVIAGEGLLLRSNTGYVLRTGDYKARPKLDVDTSDSKPRTYADTRVFEFLMPDDKILTFEVIGETED